MTWTSIVAIYVLFWVICAFVVLPFGIRTHDELNMPKVAGQADSAPGNFKPLRVILLTSLLASFAFALFYFNYQEGWITIRDIDFFGSFDEPGE